MQQTNFQKVIDFNEQFGVKIYDKPDEKIFDIDPKLINLRMNLIREEIKELEQAVTKKDYIETIDALADILYVVYGMGVSIGIDLDRAFDLVHKSNMSKLCKNEQEAQDTVKWYHEQYIENKLPYDSADYRRSEDGKYWVVYNKSTGKILKSINYNVVDLVPLIKNINT